MSMSALLGLVEALTTGADDAAGAWFWPFDVAAGLDGAFVGLEEAWGRDDVVLELVTSVGLEPF